MASETEPSSTALFEEWDAARVRASLAYIEQLQSEIKNLRSTLPSVLRSSSCRVPTKSEFYANFHKAAVGAVRELEDFKSNWLSQDTQDILQRAAKRREADPDLSKAVGINKYGWIAEFKENGNYDMGMAEDMKAVSERWKETHQDVTVQYAEAEDRITLQFKAGSLRLHSTINKAATDKHENPTYNVKFRSGTSFSASIERCIASRPRPGSLLQTLDMLASYSDFLTASCAVCECQMDRHCFLPTARRLRAAKTKKGKLPTSEWVAVHEKCLPQFH